MAEEASIIFMITMRIMPWLLPRIQATCKSGYHYGPKAGRTRMLTSWP